MSYQERYYSYQTKARGLLSVHSLTSHFEKLRIWYEGRIQKFLPVNLNAKCLDIPCGYGNFLYFLRAKGYRNIAGFDLDESQVGLACLLELPAKKGDAFDVLAESIDQFDLISSLDFIEHLSKDDALKFIEECRNRLNDGGVLILRTPCADGPFGAHDAWNDLTHKWGMTSNVLQTILELIGFSKVYILDERPVPTSLLNTIRWLVFLPTKAFASAFCMALGMRPPRIWTRSMIAVAYK